MINSISFVAKSQFLPEFEFSEFAKNNLEKYKIEKINGQLYVSNWFVDSLIKEFKQSNLELCDYIFKQKVLEIKNNTN